MRRAISLPPSSESENEPCRDQQFQFDLRSYLHVVVAKRSGQHAYLTKRHSYLDNQQPEIRESTATIRRPGRHRELRLQFPPPVFP